MSNDELYELWQRRLLEFLTDGGFNVEKNKKLVEAMFNGAKEYVKSQK